LLGASALSGIVETLSELLNGKLGPPVGGRSGR
jgi:hypothetical protein